MNAEPAKRSLLSFSLRALLLFMLVVTLLSIWVGRQQAILTRIEAAGWQVSFDTDERKEPNWWDLLFDPNLLDHIVGVNYVSDSEEIDVAPLAQLKNLQWLAVHGTQVTDLAPLAQLKNLKWLVVANTRVEDLTPLAELKNLERLDVSNTRVWDLSPLAQLKNLNWLKVSDTQVSDLTPLAELRNLRLLWVADTQVSDQQVRQLQAALPICRIVD